jgi:hypothetical protein
MIGTNGAVVLLVVNLIFTTVLGTAAGGIACFVLRRPWGLKTALIDAVLAATVAVAAAYLISAIDNARGVLESRVVLVLGIPAVSVVVRHLLRPAPRSSSRAGAE